MQNNFGAHIKAVYASHHGKHEPPETDLLQEVFRSFTAKQLIVQNMLKWAC